MQLCCGSPLPHLWLVVLAWLVVADVIPGWLGVMTYALMYDARCAQLVPVLTFGVCYFTLCFCFVVTAVASSRAIRAVACCGACPAKLANVWPSLGVCIASSFVMLLCMCVLCWVGASGAVQAVVLLWAVGIVRLSLPGDALSSPFIVTSALDSGNVARCAVVVVPCWAVASSVVPGGVGHFYPGSFIVFAFGACLAAFRSVAVLVRCVAPFVITPMSVLHLCLNIVIYRFLVLSLLSFCMTLL